MKYYHLKACTPYAGEELEDYVTVESDSELYDKKDELMEDCAAEWAPCFEEDYREYGYDSAEDFEEDYYAGCGCTATEITYEEYLEATK